jgi:GMP synthase-like glutamine amidotransferase
MEIIALQHVPFEGPARLADWCQERSHNLRCLPVYSGLQLPDPDSFDWLWILGGPMSVHDERMHPWLAPEKRFLRRLLATDRPMLGICLGAQLISQCMGGEVRGNPQREIGWFPLRLDDAQGLPLRSLPGSFTAMHWHGETFSLPPGCLRLAHSEACANQGFVNPDATLAGLQCHLEWDRPTAEALFEHAADDLRPGRFVQSREQILAGFEATDGRAELLFPLLDELADAIAKKATANSVSAPQTDAAGAP